MHLWTATSLAIAALALTVPARASNGLEPTHISLPSGPGSIEGLGRNFAPSLASGTASYGVDIAVPPSASGFEPHLSLDYDSSGGVTELGMGWRLSGLPRIRRRTENGLPRFTASDPIEISGMGVPCDLLQVAPGTFRPEYESGAFVRVQQAGADGWQARDKSGITWSFGGAGFEEAEGANVAAYLPSKAVDLHGHAIAYQWDTSSGYALLEHVTWNDFGTSARNEIVFSYENRPDPHLIFASGIKQALTKRMTAIEVRHGGALVRRYELTYGQDVHSRLASVTLVGRDGTSKLPTLSLAYTPQSLKPTTVAMQNPPGRTPGDPNIEISDLDGDGLPDLLVTLPGQYSSFLNHDGVSWQPEVDWDPSASPSLALGQTGVQLADLDGDGAIDLVAKSGTNDFRFFPGATATSFGTPVQIATVPNFTFEDPDVKLADMDGDRRIDVVVTTVDGIAIGYNLSGVDWTVPQIIGQVDPRQPLRFSDGGHTQLCDVNGDRVEDFCYLTPGSLVYWLGRGRGVFEPAVTATGVPSFDPSSPWELHDLNGDGWVDLVHVDPDQVEFVLATAAGKFGAPQTLKDVPTKNPTTTIRYADMNGNGSTDIVWIDVAGSPANAWQYVELFPAGRAGLLERVDNGLGKVETMTYGPAALDAAAARTAGNPWTTRINVPMDVVRSTKIDDSLGDPVMETDYTYANGTFSPAERTFAGFGGGTQRDVGDLYTPTLVTTSTFDVGLDDRTLRGVVLTTQTGDETGTTFTSTQTTWTTRQLQTAMDGRTVNYSFKASAQTSHIEGKDPSKARVTLVEWDQDAYGNTISERNWGEVVGSNKLAGNDEAITVRTFANNTDDWVLGHLATEELQDAAGHRVRMTQLYYDGQPFRGLSLGQVARGDAAREMDWVGPDPSAFELASSTSYDADGNPTETRDARGGGHVMRWDPTDHTSILSESLKTDGGMLTESATVDPAFGLVLSVIGYNGQATTVSYDAFGRVTAVVRPGDTEDKPTTTYGYQQARPLSRVVTTRRTWSGRDETEVTEELVDGLGRKRGSLELSAGQWVLAHVGLLDGRGNARRTLRPRFVGVGAHDSPPLQQDADGDDAWRDALGRTVRARSQLGIGTRTAFLPFGVQHWDGAQSDQSSPYEHTPVTDQHDGLERVVSHSYVLRGSTLSATFSYDAADDLLTKTDPDGNVSRYGYDGRGRRVLVVDPDAGRHGYVYDANGNVLEHHRPDGVVTRATYDLANRSLTQDWDGNGAPDVVNVWDASDRSPGSPLFAGLLAKVTDQSGVTEYEYDERQRQTAGHVTVAGQTYDSASAFDSQDREYWHQYPDRSSIRVNRDERGLVSGYGQAISIAYDADGAEMKRTFNTGVAQTLSYDGDRRAHQKRAVTADGRTILDLQWSYDGAGNILSVADARPTVPAGRDRSEQYEYDNLYRLSGVRGAWGQAQWVYSPSGNLLQRTSSVSALEAPSFAYGRGAGPHALTQFGQRTIRYDADGRMVNDGDRSYEWNAADQLVHVARADRSSVDSTFDATGARRTRTEHFADGSSHQTVFLDAWSEVRDGKLIRFIVHGGKRVVRLADGNGVPSGRSGGCTVGDEPPAGASLWLLLPCSLAVVATRRRRVVAAAAALVLSSIFGCSSGAGGPPPVLDGTIQTLSDADELLFDDATGSLSETTTGTGTPKGSFASYPFGLSRWDDSDETRKYANSPRDESMNLDQMGARWYAFDLGVWTSVDPLRLEKPGRGVASTFAADHPYAYAALTPIVAVDPDGRDPLPEWAQGALGFTYGLIQGATPGGFLTNAIPLPEGAKTPAFQYWQGAGQVLGGTADVVGGGAVALLGVGADSTGVGTIVGVPANVAGIAMVASGTTSVLAGGARMIDAADKMQSSSSGGAEPLPKKSAGPKSKTLADPPATEEVERAMSNAELEATKKTGLVRGGRAGTHYVSDAISNSASKAQKRLALPQKPQVKVTLEVPKGRFSPPERIQPDYGQPGGGLQRTATGDVPAKVVKAEPMKP
jgi:RHS repeat-associated protein